LHGKGVIRLVTMKMPMSSRDQRWLARLTPISPLTVTLLLTRLRGVDVWERHAASLVVAAGAGDLLEIDRQQLAKVEWLCTIDEYLSRH